ncbi:predicted protein [Naegleria gruberi]|uniref:Conserved oligomeric Golgi complex subunit 3 n=1 Tax=Naegleria gruberi TaxID=5762 RepID=D2UZA5_NAEGR|nr:uncharacterized protein NAEGRDRAFT_29692 [Naegleria gruberi]EFC50117.1 predicted protein [Naegleria gruberi]|eukprot:XP_002682861.1 predicted protein [Naegleria gruberi strain NEG-M]
MDKPPSSSSSAADDQQSSLVDFSVWNSGDFLYQHDFDQQVDKPYEDYLTKLRHYQELSHSLIVASNNTLALSDDLQEQYQLVSQKTSRLHHDCETLVKETEQLEKFSKELENRLLHFDDMDFLNQQLTSSGFLDVNGETFIKTIGKLDDSINFLSANLEYKEAKTFLTKHKYLLSKSLAHLRDTIGSKIKATTDAQFVKLKSLNSIDDSIQEMTHLYIDFKVAVDPLKALIRELEKRGGRRESSVFITDLFDIFIQQRGVLLGLSIERRITLLLNQAKQSENEKTFKTKFIRSSCEYMIQICSQETQLFQQLFSLSKDNRQIGNKFSHFMKGVTNILYERVRELIIEENRIDTLCSLIDILRSDILVERVQNKGKPSQAIEHMVHAMIQDIQERLIYRTSLFITNEIARYVPHPEDIDYPNKLKAQNDPSSSETARKQLDIHYPTLGWTVALLSKLFSALDVVVFEGMAQEAVTICSMSFIDASKKISDKTDALNGSLFLISHFLTLLQELSYFNVSFTKTQTTLDFSHLYEGISRFLKGQASFSVTSLIFDLLSQTRPRLVVNSTDSKRDLEKQLKLACENFILNTVKHVADSCMNFIKKNNINKDSQETSEIMKEISNIKSEMNEEMTTKLTYIKELMKLYLNEDKTTTKLLEPIIEQLVSLYQQLLDFIAESTKLSAEQKAEITRDMLDVESFRKKLTESLKV